MSGKKRGGNVPRILGQTPSDASGVLLPVQRYVRAAFPVINLMREGNDLFTRSSEAGVSDPARSLQLMTQSRDTYREAKTRAEQLTAPAAASEGYGMLMRSIDLSLDATEGAVPALEAGDGAALFRAADTHRQGIECAVQYGKAMERAVSSIAPG